MPELPEVETVCRGLDSTICDSVIDHVEVKRFDLRIEVPHDFAERLEGMRITAIKRRAKYLCIYGDNNCVILGHLGMSGTITIVHKDDYTPRKHDHIIIALSSDDYLVFRDPRRFGLMTLTTAGELENHPLLSALGPEPLSDHFDGSYLYAQCRTRRSPIKSVIMDNHIVVGVGNIYACESLFHSQVHPTRLAHKLTKSECEHIVLQIKKVLIAAIESGGSTLRDYVRSSGDLGYFQHQFYVYGREKEPCYHCGTLIERLRQSGRSSFFCKQCQS